MVIDFKEAQDRLNRNEEVWFFINRYSDMNQTLYQSTSPTKLGSIYSAYNSDNDMDLPIHIYAMGKKGAPLAKAYKCSEKLGWTPKGSEYCRYKIFALFFSDKESCDQYFNDDLRRIMREMSATDAARSAEVKRKLLKVSRRVLR